MANPPKDTYFESGSLAKPPRFNADNFPLWKSRMELFLSGSDPQIPYFLEHGPYVPTSIVPVVAATTTTPAAPERTFYFTPSEYEALIAGLDIAYNLGARHLHVRSDSLLVVNQLNGDFQAKDSKMMTYLKIAKKRIARFEAFSIEQILQDLNVQADALANLGSTFNEPTLESIPMNEEVYNWSLDIWNYLKHDQLPDDKMEARKTRSKAS
ncbi:hypothetical protein OSB04_un001868 [Centaurea solstitialis]|uniref:RNase H type-1 domain-containing protein n=1 Tax=Centaurea solstitialis TaxID=347529 RepID=A0AA38SEY0_9ASTR|nr:hypothetical protein OSB04_un001868 [Centaurea solstitialis]